MVTFFCQNCWAEVPETATICPHCGDDIAARQTKADYVDKLIAALHHPEPTTPVRVAWILGERRESKAVPSLIQIASESADPFLVESAIEALGKIGNADGLEAVFRASNHPSLRVRAKARKVLQTLRSGVSP